MSATGYATFDTTLEKTNGILKQIEQAYGWPKERRNRSYNALRAVLHAVCDRLTVEDAAQWSAQLPMLVRGIYFEGWDPTRVPLKMHLDEFLARARDDFPHEVNSFSCRVEGWCSLHASRSSTRGPDRAGEEDQHITSCGRPRLTSGAREGGELPPREGQPVTVHERVDRRPLTTDDHLRPSRVGGTGQSGDGDEQRPKALSHVTSSRRRAVGATSCGVCRKRYR